MSDCIETADPPKASVDEWAEYDFGPLTRTDETDSIRVRGLALLLNRTSRNLWRYTGAFSTAQTIARHAALGIITADEAVQQIIALQHPSEHA